jgi:hypothetical protein
VSSGTGVMMLRPVNLADSCVYRTGMIGSRHGIFPSNYVKMKE